MGDGPPLVGLSKDGYCCFVALLKQALTVEPRLTSSSGSPCLSLSNAKITSKHYHTRILYLQRKKKVLFPYNTTVFAFWCYINFSDNKQFQFLYRKKKPALKMEESWELCECPNYVEVRGVCVEVCTLCAVCLCTVSVCIVCIVYVCTVCMCSVLLYMCVLYMCVVYVYTVCVWCVYAVYVCTVCVCSVCVFVCE